MIFFAVQKDAYTLDKPYEHKLQYLKGVCQAPQASLHVKNTPPTRSRRERGFFYSWFRAPPEGSQVATLPVCTQEAGRGTRHLNHPSCFQASLIPNDIAAFGVFAGRAGWRTQVGSCEAASKGGAQGKEGLASSSCEGRRAETKVESAKRVPFSAVPFLGNDQHS